MTLPNEVQSFLRTASDATTNVPMTPFVCKVFESPWDEFVEQWAVRCYWFVYHALGTYGMQPLPEILPLPDGMHSAGATASFDPSSGQIRISRSVEFRAGQTLEKLTHELTHASLAQFPQGDDFYSEGFVDYSTWVLSHAPVWEPYREEMIEASNFNIRMRRERALKDLSDWDRKRWAGGLYASLARGPFVVASLRSRKNEGNFNW
jgi:hypothetical protein